MSPATLPPKKQHLAEGLRFVEQEADKEATALKTNRERLSRAYYGLAIPSAVLAAAAATTALAEYTVISGACASLAALKSSLMVYLRSAYEDALAQQMTETRYIVLRTRARQLRIRARYVSIHALEQQAVELESDLEILRLSRFVRATPLTSDLSATTHAH